MYLPVTVSLEGNEEFAGYVETDPCPATSGISIPAFNISIALLMLRSFCAIREKDGNSMCWRLSV